MQATLKRTFVNKPINTPIAFQRHDCHFNVMTLPFSILDLARITEGNDIARSFAECVDTAQKAESLGYHRVWYAEHHNMESVASSATSVLIAHIAAQTKSIRLGSGGVMLPNHSPLTIAEQFGTLETLHPGRIDLGLGRAPGGDGHVIRALRKDAALSANQFPQDVMELMTYLGDAEDSDLPIRAIPGEGTKVPVWILGSSLFGAQLAAHLGLPYAFASHFAPQYLRQAAEIYRRDFQPSAHLDKPYFMMACNVCAADTEDEAQFHFTTLLQAFIGIITNQRGPIRAPVRDLDIPAEIQPHLETMLQASAVGTVDQVAERLSEFQRELQPDEFILSMPFYHQAARLKSLELTLQAREKMAELTKAA